MSQLRPPGPEWNPSGVLACTTDFGLHNGFVGTMQGVFCGLAPGAQWIDLTHGIPAQNLVVAAIELRAAWDYFPVGSLHLAVVDPGVGSGRRILCGARQGRLLLGPDNGLLPEVLGPGEPLWQVDSAPWQLEGASHTFHGRDLFVPLAAALLRGDLRLENATPVQDPILLQPRPRPEPGALGPGKEIVLSILMADRFGNLICDWDARELGPPAPGSKIRVRDHEILIHRTYGDVGHGEYLALINSWGYLEIAQRDGSAAQGLSQNPGDSLRMTLGG